MQLIDKVNALWLAKNLPPIFQPIRSKTKTTDIPVARIFPRLTRLHFLMRSDWFICVNVCSDWPQDHHLFSRQFYS